MTEALISGARLHAFAPHCDELIFAPHLDQVAAQRGITTPLRIAHFLAQGSVETAGFTRMEEALGYSAERLVAVWPSRFPSLETALPFAHNPEALANKVYGGRMGNDQAGDGWRFRGRGFGITGRFNYRRFGQLAGLDLENDPDLAAEPSAACAIFGAYWDALSLNNFADRDDGAGITKAINGGLIGLSDRLAALARAKTIWAA